MKITPRTNRKTKHENQAKTDQNETNKDAAEVRQTIIKQNRNLANVRTKI